MKKIYTVIGVFILICFSFYYTESAVNIVKRNDPIMKEIIKVSGEYKDSSIDAVLVNNNIIPGKVGIELDIDKSYTKMKKLGKFNTSLLEFKEVIPNISITKNYDKFIISGNKTNNMISLVFKMKDTTYLEEIIDILKSKGLTSDFFLDYSNINNPSTINLLINNNMQVSYLGNNYQYNKSDLLVVNEILTKKKNKNIYCYSEGENKDIIDICSKEKIHTIIPSINTTSNPYYDIKTKLENGSIIKLDNSKTTIKQLRYIINYLKSKGYKIVDLNTLLKE